MFKPQRDLKFYKPESLNKIFGEIITDKSNSSPYKIFILDIVNFESDSYRHLLNLKLINSRKIVMYKNSDVVIEDTKIDLSLEVSEDLCSLLDNIFLQHEKIGGKKYGLYAEKGNVYIHLR